MSQETSQWLNTYTRIGFEDKRGKAHLITFGNVLHRYANMLDDAGKRY